MKRLLAGILALVLLCGCGAAAPPDGETAETQAASEGQDAGEAAETLRVCASFYPLYDFAGKIGGDLIELDCLVPAGAEPHDWEPSTADMVRLENADLFLYNGAGLEPWADSLIASLQNENLHLLEASAGMVAEEDEHEHEDEDDDHDHDDEEEHGHSHDHGGTDPHVWLSPVLAKAQAEAVKELLVELDPGNADAYEDNWRHWSAEFDKLDESYREALAAVPNREIVVAHAAFGYLCREYELEQIAAQGFSPDAEPDPASMAEVIELAREREIRVIFFEELASPKVAEAIAREIGAETAVLNPLEGLSAEQEAAGEDYFSLMYANLEALVSALS